ncbi:MAG: hypothetical protein LBJ88_01875 [Campylobacteraceae bacterium]|jgi:Spy/CpxP family protein refolding chaperone|nr:hypothetical protein [Campylobacteraceae bacterium]
MRKGLFILITASLLSVSGAFAKHQTDDLSRHGKHAFKVGETICENGFIGGHGDKFLEKLDLSLEQKEQIKLLQKEMFLKIEAIFENTGGLKTYFDKNSFNKEAFLNDKKEINDTLVDIRADYLDKIYNILTDIQKEEIYEILGKIENRKWGKH